MAASLEGKVALVTGVSRDGQVGQTVAKVLAENGAALAICARTQSKRLTSWSISQEALLATSPQSSTA